MRRRGVLLCPYRRLHAAMVFAFAVHAFRSRLLVLFLRDALFTKYSGARRISKKYKLVEMFIVNLSFALASRAPADIGLALYHSLHGRYD